MQVHKVELVIIDFDEVGIDDIKDILENTRYPNYCISPKVISTSSRDCGEWSDDHPLNDSGATPGYIHYLFS